MYSIVVVTDGYVNVEREAFDLIRNNLNQSNLFAFGIGSGVNRHLIEGMAHVGMGTPFIITSKKGADAKADLFRAYIEKPVLTQVSVDYDGFEAYDVEPTSVADVLSNRPILIYGKYKGEAKGNIKLKGYTGADEPYYANFKVSDVLPDSRNVALKYLWARERIRLMDDYKLIEDSDEIKQLVTNIGLKYSLMTAYTSFVAIDEDHIASNGLPKKVNQPLPLPESVSNTAVGFDLEITGISRASKPRAKANKKTISPSDMQIIQSLIKGKLEILMQCQKEGMAMPKDLIIELTIDKNGNILTVNIIHSTLEESIKLCMQDQLQGIQLLGMNVTAKTTVSIPISFLK